jgi:hypothetical protein
MTLRILNPLRTPRWDELLLANPNATLFHSARWARVLYESYGYEPLCFVSFKNGAMEVLLPFMEVRSVFTGKRGVSLPFTDYCEPILPDSIGFQDVLDVIIRHSSNAGWDTIELRGCNSLPADITPSSVYYRHIIDLTKGEKALLAGLRQSTRNNIRKCERTGTTVTMDTSRDAVRHFCRLNCMTRKLHGLPPQPFSFFEMIQKHLLAQDSGIVAIASHEGKVVAGAVFLHFGDKALYKYGASDRRYQHLRANNLIMWQAMEWYARKGFQSLCLGRTEPENDGLLQFKRGWGVTEEMLPYYKYNLKRSVFVREPSKTTGFFNPIFRAMPIPFLRLTGALLYRHMG